MVIDMTRGKVPTGPGASDAGLGGGLEGVDRETDEGGTLGAETMQGINLARFDSVDKLLGSEILIVLMACPMRGRVSGWRGDEEGNQLTTRTGPPQPQSPHWVPRQWRLQ